MSEDGTGACPECHEWMSGMVCGSCIKLAAALAAKEKKEKEKEEKEKSSSGG